ncbi:MAG: ribosomal L7Ae/L30e/S12e/Gadd45 family protein [Firmicutes bacterium]|nr:ribosomal L7Ae/L30e/S12e/Gadd45 family protein [Bacillota bacterium]
MTNNNRRVLELLGLCRKAGLLKSGEEGCEQAVKASGKGQVPLILLSSDASYRTVKKFQDKCSFYHVPHAVVPFTKEEIGTSLGLSPRSVLAVMEPGLQTLIQKALQTSLEEVDHIGETQY